MRFEFQCTLDDFREAQAGHAAAARPSSLPKRVMVGMVGWFVYVLLVFAFIILVQAPWKPLPPGFDEREAAQGILPGGRVMIVRFLMASFPTAALAAGLGMAAVRQALKPKRPWAPARPAKGWGQYLPASTTVLMVIASSLVILVFAIPLDTTPTGDPKPTLYEIFLSLVSFGLFFCLSVLITLVNKTRGMRRAWQDQPALARPYVMEASDAGFKLVEAQSSHEYQWSALPGFRETANLLLIYVSGVSFWFIPKRAFATPAALQGFKALLMTHVVEGQFLRAESQSFPVVPLTASIPADGAKLI